MSWESLMSRSIEAAKVLVRDVPRTNKWLFIDFLQRYTSLNDFLSGAPTTDMMFWFFQRRDTFLSQRTMKKWSRDALDDYVPLPATNGFVNREECIFVSHFWRTQEHPDPDGEYLRLFQAELRPQQWSYIWVDWTCMPQSPRSQVEEVYFLRSLETMSGIIRNASFIWFYPPRFEARLWMWYEVAERTLTSIHDVESTPDISEFKSHVQEMMQTSVRLVLDKYSYRCTQDRDKAYLTSWLELLVLLRKLHLEFGTVRMVMDNLTWFTTAEDYTLCAKKLQLRKFDGTLIHGGKHYNFTPFPRWNDGKYSAKRLA